VHEHKFSDDIHNCTKTIKPDIEFRHCMRGFFISPVESAREQRAEDFSLEQA